MLCEYKKIAINLLQSIANQINVLLCYQQPPNKAQTKTIINQKVDKLVSSKRLLFAIV